ncbi:hypothetical protein BH09PSE5_BH09PSE5_44070 [soil metagenome]
MRVDEVLGLGEYWRDARFRAKRPGSKNSPGDHPPDNFYKPGRDGTLVRVDNPLHGADLASSDISGRNAIVSRHFWYFGDQSPQLPTDLIHLVHSGQGHSLHVNRHDGDLATLQQWLSHWPRGVLGAPIDARKYRHQKAGRTCG